MYNSVEIPSNKRTLSKLLQPIFDFDAWQWFTIVVLTYLIGVFINQEFILTDAVYYNSFGEQLAYEQIASMMHVRSHWGWLTYVISPLIVALRTTLVSLCLLVGILWKNQRLPFKQLWAMVMKAEMVYAIGSVVIAISLLSLQNVHTFNDIGNFHGYSMLAFVKLEGLAVWLRAPLRFINLFELGYWFMLIWGLQHLMKESFSSMFRLTVSTYGIGLLLWMVLMLFLEVSFS